MVRLAPPSGRRPLCLEVERLEDRLVPTWGSPWLAMTPVPPAVKVDLNSAGHAQGSGGISFTEIDWVRFTARATGTYHLTVNTPNSNLDPIVGVYSKDDYRLTLVGA